MRWKLNASDPPLQEEEPESNLITYADNTRADTTTNHRFIVKKIPSLSPGGDHNPAFKTHSSHLPSTEQPSNRRQVSTPNLSVRHLKAHRSIGREAPSSQDMSNTRVAGNNFNQPHRVGEGGIYIISGGNVNYDSNPSTIERRNPMAHQSTGNGSTTGGGGGSCSLAAGTSSMSSANGIGSDSSQATNDIVSECQSNYAGNEAANEDFHFVSTVESSSSFPVKDLSNSGSFHLKNGSTAKLLPLGDEESNTQTKCSVFRGLVLCICLNVSYANIVRFPRELDQYGSAYLVPYIVLLFLVGLPTILLEVSIGQFLGQGAAHTWRSSPIFKGACIISRFASWLASTWIALQAVVSAAYIGVMIFKSLAFTKCHRNITFAFNEAECIQSTVLTPLWENTMYFGMLSIGLIIIWVTVMLCTHNAKVFRRMLFIFGLVGFVLLCTLTAWEVHASLERQYFPELWYFNKSLLLDSKTWFNALVQVIYATNIGFGALPVVTGKFLYKGDAVRTSVVYLCFNLLINAIAVTLFMVQYDNMASRSFGSAESLKPLAAIYYRILNEPNDLVVKTVSCVIYGLIIISAIVSITIAVYTLTRLVPHHPNYVVSLVGFLAAVISMIAPNFTVPQVLDTRLVGTLVITALIFDLIATTWIYGAKNIYTDLEFSVGRPIFKGWVYLWCLGPAFFTGILVWWCADDDRGELLSTYIPRWGPIIFVIFVILIIACVEIFKQVDYNFFGMICEAAKPAKEWGPADPLARHAWKQWRSVCQDTGRKDFTLRRRGTRDYTHSIKKGQYTTSKYGSSNWKSSTPGNSSPNYSGSVFGDSAIEEDISVDKYSGINQQFTALHNTDCKGLRYSQRSRQVRPSHERQESQKSSNGSTTATIERHKEVVYIRNVNDDKQNHATRIEITPSTENITYATRNPMGRNTSQSFSVSNRTPSTVQPNGHVPATSLGQLPTRNGTGVGDHVCWRKFTVNSDEYSTEL